MEEISHSLGIDIIDPTGAVRNAALDSDKYTVTSRVVHPDMYFEDDYLTQANLVVEGDDIFGPHPSTLGIFDIAALQEIYGVDTTTRLGDTTYQMGASEAFGATASDAFVYTIWDAGGNDDEIDASGYADGVQIDLREGHFSSIGKNGNSNGDRVIWDSGSYDAGNVGIAYGAEIENAIGTSHNDHIIGNDLDNIITGGAGDDILSGGAGSDTYVFNLGDGHDSIEDDWTGFNQIEFGSGISTSTVSYAEQGDDLRIILDSSNSILFKNYLANSTNIDEDVGFDDGSQTDFFSGTTSGDYISGSSDSEVFFGLDGDDTISTGHGDDTVFGGGGNDIVHLRGASLQDKNTAYGGPGDDRLFILSGQSALFGGDGNDFLQLSSNPNAAGFGVGGAGDDDFWFTSNAFQMDGEDGNDMYYYSSSSWNSLSINHSITDTSGSDDHIRIAFSHPLGINDIYLSSLGDDLFVANASGSGIVVENYFAFSDSVERIETRFGSSIASYDITSLLQPFGMGSGGDDLLVGTASADTLQGFGGDDVLEGNLGNDTLDGGAGLDTASYANASGAVIINLTSQTASGADGSDTFISIENATGSEFNDIFVGGAGNSTMRGNGGVDTITGWAGADILYGGSGNDVLYGDDTNSSASYVGAGDDTIYGDAGDAGNDLIYGGDDDDTIYGAAGNDTIHGDAGDDLIYADYSTASANDGADIVYGGAGEDTIVGSGGDDQLHGGDDEDTIYGGGGEDEIWGDGGNDLIYGDDDDDTLHGGDGEDIIYGGGGLDTIYGDGGNDQINGEEITDYIYGGEGHDWIWGYEGDDILYRGNGNDTLYGDDQYNTAGWTGAGDDTLHGEAGNDVLAGGEGDDTLHGGDGSDTLYGHTGDDILNGDAGLDLIYGGDGADTLRGGGDADTLIAGDGADTLYADEGIDKLWGQGGVDTFVFEGESAFNGRDLVRDFTAGETIDISDVLSDFGYVDGTDVLADWVQITSAGGHSFLEIDRDGTGTSYSMTDLMYTENYATLAMSDVTTV